MNNPDKNMKMLLARVQIRASQVSLAKAVRSSQSTISAIELNKCVPDLALATRIARKLNLDVAELFPNGVKETATEGGGAHE